MKRWHLHVQEQISKREFRNHHVAITAPDDPEAAWDWGNTLCPQLFEHKATVIGVDPLIEAAGVSRPDLLVVVK